MHPLIYGAWTHRMQLKTEHQPNNAPVSTGIRRDAAAADLMDNSDQYGQSVRLPGADT